MVQKDPFSDVSLLLGATPIGNLGDASARLVAALAHAQVIACEDTRNTRALAAHLGVQARGRFVAFHEHNEDALAAQLLEQVRRGTRVLVVSDAGMPLISDPGYRLVTLAAQAGVGFSVLPGPSAPLTALALSGLPTDSFSFLGFVPRRTGARREFLARAGALPQTLIFFESPHRVTETLQVMADLWGAARRVAVCRELTKLHEEAVRGPLGEVAQTLRERGEVRGEIVIIAQGGPAHPAAAGNGASLANAAAKMKELTDLGVRTKDASKLLSRWFGVSAKALYESALETKN